MDNISQMVLNDLLRGIHQEPIIAVNFNPTPSEHIVLKELEFYDENYVRFCMIENVTFDRCKFNTMSFRNCYLQNVRFVDCRYGNRTCKCCKRPFPLFQDCALLNVNLSMPSEYGIEILLDCSYSDLVLHKGSAPIADYKPLLKLVVAPPRIIK